MASDVIFSFHELRFQATALSASADKPVSMHSVLSVFQKIAQWNSVLPYSHSTAQNTIKFVMPVVRISEDSRFIDLLFVLTDPNRTDRTLTHLDTGATRATARDDREGHDFRSHVVLRLSNTHPEKYTALMAIEREHGSGITPNKIRIFLDKLLDEARLRGTPDWAAFFTEPHPSGSQTNGQPDLLKFKMRTHIESIFSEDVLKAFKDGRVKDIVLHNTKHMDIPDSNGKFRQTKSEMVFKVNSDIIRAESDDYDSMLGDFSEAFNGLTKSVFDTRKIPVLDQKFTIHYQNEYGHERTAHYDPCDTLDLALVKKIPIQLDSLRRVVPPTFIIEDEVSDKIKPHLTNHR